MRKKEQFYAETEEVFTNHIGPCLFFWPARCCRRINNAKSKQCIEDKKEEVHPWENHTGE
jgi:hypothetical protein